ncbi:hypothetical protein HPB52_013084 [Rhipicephalus sanguineus]|uniref:THAP-type domain-containing protein n=1 Tax=Rhipicephalus sanguineus TaxID=34632 RepID=A0A9D4PMR4_RHISA|nr:hypothetical protein HPB52_013084 [Rhipicephalus sanguineus]
MKGPTATVNRKEVSPRPRKLVEFATAGGNRIVAPIEARRAAARIGAKVMTRRREVAVTAASTLRKHETRTQPVPRLQTENQTRPVNRRCGRRFYTYCEQQIREAYTTTTGLDRAPGASATVRDVVEERWFFDGARCVQWDFSMGDCPSSRGGRAFRSLRECSMTCLQRPRNRRRRLDGVLVPQRSRCLAPLAVTCDPRDIRFPYFADMNARGSTRCVRASRSAESALPRRIGSIRLALNLQPGLREFTTGRSVSYHALPKNSRRRKLWLAALGEKLPSNWTKVRICSGHFRDEDFVPAVQNGRRLLPTAVPRVCLYNAHGDGTTMCYPDEVTSPDPVPEVPEPKDEAEAPCSKDEIARLKEQLQASDMIIENLQQQPSGGWIQRFKERHGILYKAFASEGAFLDVKAKWKWVDETLPHILVTFTDTDIYNDEIVALIIFFGRTCFRLQPASFSSLAADACILCGLVFFDLGVAVSLLLPSSQCQSSPPEFSSVSILLSDLLFAIPELAGLFITTLRLPDPLFAVSETHSPQFLALLAVSGIILNDLLDHFRIFLITHVLHALVITSLLVVPWCCLVTHVFLVRIFDFLFCSLSPSRRGIYRSSAVMVLVLCPLVVTRHRPSQSWPAGRYPPGLDERGGCRVELFSISSSWAHSGSVGPGRITFGTTVGGAQGARTPSVSLHLFQIYHLEHKCFELEVTSKKFCLETLKTLEKWCELI